MQFLDVRTDAIICPWMDFVLTGRDQNRNCRALNSFVSFVFCLMCELRSFRFASASLVITELSCVETLSELAHIRCDAHSLAQTAGCQMNAQETGSYGKVQTLSID